jgi:hypothetical protein
VVIEDSKEEVFVCVFRSVLSKEQMSKLSFIFTSQVKV